MRGQICVEEDPTADYYERFAESYAARFESVDLVADRELFQRSLPSGGRVLDAGCAAGRDCARFASAGLVPFGVDLSARFAAAAHRQAAGQIARADVRVLPFRDDAFDGVWSCAVLVHLSPTDACIALEELGRVTRPGGSLFISTRFGSGSEWRSGPEDGSRWFQSYSVAEIGGMVHNAGFDISSARCESGVVSGEWVNVHATRRSS